MKMIRHTLLALCSLSLALPAQAANMRVLLIGVGRYPTEIDSLPGIDLDIQNMRNVVAAMGA